MENTTLIKHWNNMLKTNRWLNFLMKVSKEEPETHIALIRDRVENAIKISFEKDNKWIKTN